MLRPQPLPPVPAETARVAHAAFPKGHPYLRAADELGEVCTDATFAALFRRRGPPALAPWRLALATILQFAEGLSDRQAADAVRARLDWKYVLRLEVDDPGFDAAVLCAFRARLIAGAAEWLLCEALLAWCQARQLLKARGRQRTDSTHVLAVVRAHLARTSWLLPTFDDPVSAFPERRRAFWASVTTMRRWVPIGKQPPVLALNPSGSVLRPMSPQVFSRRPATSSVTPACT